MTGRDDLRLDPGAPATERERACADELRAALDDPSVANEQAELARALSAAWSPRDLDQQGHRAIVERALRPRRARASRVWLAASAAVALAAAVALVVKPGRAPAPRGAAAVAFSRSTQPLFGDRFAPAGGQTARIDRIAMARAADLRDNEFARWGVR